MEQVAIGVMSQKKTGGLAGVIAGRTDICTVGKEGAGLRAWAPLADRD